MKRASLAVLLALIPLDLSAQGPSLRVGVRTPLEQPAALKRTSKAARRNQQYVLRSWGWGNGFTVGAFGGELYLQRSVKPGGQDLLGATLGFVFGHGTTIRGYYWKGINDGWDDTEPIQSYGAEAQLDLVGAGPVRFVILGGAGPRAACP